MNPFDPIESFWRTLELWVFLAEWGWLIFPIGMLYMLGEDLYRKRVKTPPPGSEPDGSQRK